MSFAKWQKIIEPLQKINQRYSRDKKPRNKQGHIQRSPEISLKASENGGYLLSHKRSTIGVAELNDPVRNGKGCDLSAITT